MRNRDENRPSPTTGTNSEAELNKELRLEPGLFIAAQHHRHLNQSEVRLFFNHLET